MMQMMESIIYLKSFIVRVYYYWYASPSMALGLWFGTRIVWQTRWITPINAYKISDSWYALGYEKKNNNSLHSHKILRCDVDIASKPEIYEFEIYNFNSNSWKFFYLPRHCDILFNRLGVSLKGNIYWLAREKHTEGQVRRQGIGHIDFLICFDFTTERFGPCLSLPFHSDPPDTVILSSVREEQLPVLFQCKDTLTMEIWVATKIEPNEVSWNKLFLVVDMEPLTHSQFKPWDASFFIDEKKMFAVVFSKDEYDFKHNLAYTIGKDGYFKEVDLGESTDEFCCHPIVFSYVPSSVKIKEPPQVMQQHHNVLVGKDCGIIGFRRWSRTGMRVNSIIQRYAPFLNTPVSAIQRWFRTNKMQCGPSSSHIHDLAATAHSGDVALLLIAIDS